MELQNPKVEAVLAKHDKQLRKVFTHYAASDAAMGDSDETINFDEYNTLLTDTKLVDATLTKKVSSEIFVRCNLSEDDDGTADPDDDNELTEVDYGEFKELLARC